MHNRTYQKIFSLLNIDGGKNSEKNPFYTKSISHKEFQRDVSLFIFLFYI